MSYQTYHRWADTALEVIGFAALATFGIPLWMVGTQVYTWLRHGFWPRSPASNWLIENNVYPSTDWAGIQSILDWLASWPAAFWVFLIGLGICSLIGWFGGVMREEGDRLWKLEKAKEEAETRPLEGVHVVDAPTTK